MSELSKSIVQESPRSRVLSKFAAKLHSTRATEKNCKHNKICSIKVEDILVADSLVYLTITKEFPAKLNYINFLLTIC